MVSFDYDPFGNLVSGDSDDSRFAFQTQQHDVESGLTYLRARYYDPTTGRFTVLDPFGGFVDDPQGQNGYNYANNDPINLTDPSGMMAEHWGSLPGTSISQGKNPLKQYLGGIEASLNDFGVAQNFLHVGPAQQVGIGVGSAGQAIAAVGSLFIGGGAQIAKELIVRNGLKFSPYYYEKLWNTGRKAPSLIANEVLQVATKVTPDVKKGFVKVIGGGWELVWNPITKEVWHLKPLK